MQNHIIISKISAINGIFAIYNWMSDRRKIQLWVLVIFMIIGALFELLTIGAVLPFITIIANPLQVEKITLIGPILNWTGLPKMPDPIWPAGIFLIITAILAAVIRLFLTWASNKFIFLLGHDLGVAIYTTILSQSYSVHVQRNSSEVIATIEKVQSLLSNVLQPAIQGLIAAVISVFIVSAIVAVDPTVALISAVLMGSIYFLISVMTKRRLRRNAVVLSESLAKRIKILQEGLGGIRDIIIDNSSSAFISQFKKADRDYREGQALAAFIAAAPRFIVESAGIILISLIAIFFSFRQGGVITALPVLGALALGVQRLLPLIQNIYYAWSSFNAYSIYLFDILSLIKLDDAANCTPSIQGIPIPNPFNRDIVLKCINFSYEKNGAVAISDLNLKIERGSRVGFIGRTGSGKSTIVDIIMGLLTPTSGSIFIDSHKLTKENIRDWHAQVAHVPQVIFLMDDTLAANIAFGEPDENIESERVEAAACGAEMNEFVATLPKGYMTKVGERGVRLSGGQRQRIGIARALYKRPSVLILDEATSALDNDTERAVMESIERLGTNITIIIIAHRLSTLSSCDLIVHLEAGRVTKMGTYNDLIKNK